MAQLHGQPSPQPQQPEYQAQASQQYPSQAYPHDLRYQTHQQPPSHEHEYSQRPQRATSYPYPQALPSQSVQPPSRVQPLPWQPISAPSPQYPLQYPSQSVLAHKPNTPQANLTSSTAVSAFRRPLPTPGVPAPPTSSFVGRSPLPTPVPTPGPIASSSRFKPPPAPVPINTLPQAQTPISASSPISPLTSSRRPLPHPNVRLPSGSFSLETSVRSPSPVKAAIATFAPQQEVLSSIQGGTSPGPTSFVPYWKRNSAAPNETPQAHHGFSWNPSHSSTATNNSQFSSGPARDRSRSVNTGRPLPLSPAQPPNIATLNLGSPISATFAAKGTSQRPRALPSPGSPPSSGNAHQRFPANASSAASGAASPVRSLPTPQSSSHGSASPTKSTFARAPSPTKSDKALSFHADKDISKPRTPSPQYGIRDLPNRPGLIDHDEARHEGEVRFTRPRPARSSTLPQPPTPHSAFQPQHRPAQSITLRSDPTFTPAQSSTPRSPGPSAPTSPSGWPSGLPPLPRAPGSGFTKQYIGGHPPTKREYVDLDDAPPPSLRRSPSPSSPSRSVVPLPPLPAFRISADTNSTKKAQTPPVLPPRSRPVSNSPSPNKPTNPLPAPASVPPHEVANIPSSSRFSEHRQRATPERKARFVERAPSVPKIAFPGDSDSDSSDSDDGGWGGPQINVSAPEVPQISISGSSDVPSISVAALPPPSAVGANGYSHLPAASGKRGAGLACGGCQGPIVGRIVSAMGTRWHPGCFRCCVCNELLEYVSSYEHAGRPYCHFDYHENFAPRCYHCKTAIVDERFITLDDAELGTRTYHEQHFFCSECGDPFLTPTIERGVGELTFTGDGDFADDGVGFTVYNGYPYCESCHVRLRSPKCKKCTKPIRAGAQAVEALGGKWCWECFTCTGCDKPFDDPAFFLRDNKAFCESCYSIIIKSEL